jgi:hypothetical protein
MREETIKICQYDELSDAAKEKARDWYRRASEGDNYFSEAVIEDAEQVAEIIGIEFDYRHWENSHGFKGKEPKVYWSGFWSQGDGASWEGSYRYKKGAVKAILEYAPQDPDLHHIALALREVQTRYFYQLSASVTTSGHYSHSGTMDVSVSYNGDDYREVAEADENEIRDLLRDFADWIYSHLESEYNYQNSDEAIEETIRANEYEFTEEGERY